MRKSWRRIALYPALLFVGSGCASTPEETPSVAGTDRFELIPRHLFYSPEVHGDQVLEIHLPTEITVGTWELTLTHDGETVFTRTGRGRPPETALWSARIDDQPAPEGSYIPSFTGAGADGPIRGYAHLPFTLDRTAPEVALTTSQSHVTTSERGETAIHFEITASDRNLIERWELTVRDSYEAVHAIITEENAPPATYSWNGRLGDHLRLQTGLSYIAKVAVYDEAGNTGYAELPFSTGVVYTRHRGKRLLSLPFVEFPPSSARMSEALERVTEAYARLVAQVSRVMRDDPTLRVEIEGHANAERYTGDTVDPTEQEGELLPLSLARSHEIQRGILSQGIDENRFETTGRGALDPAVPFDNDQEVWRNRRVHLYQLE